LSNYYRPGGFGGFSFFPPVIKNLLTINGVIFLLQSMGSGITANGSTLNEIITKYFALIPIQGIAGLNEFGKFITMSFYLWPLISYQFLHGCFCHILFNMFALWMFGMEIENLWGSKKFLYFYLLCGVAAGLTQLFISPLLTNRIGPTVGASGAIYGVLIAFAMMFPNRYIFLYFLIPVKAKYFIGFLVLMQLMFFSGGESNIAFLAHLGGALAGFLYVWFDPRSNSEIRSVFRRSSYRTSTPFNPFGAMSEKFKKKTRPDIEDAKYYEIEDEEEKITQQQIDEILDKISQSGYQNLTEKEKKILFEASRKMK